MTSVLIIEDNEDNWELIQFLLESAGYQTQHVFSGEDGVAVLGQQAFDLLICDIQLPGMDGQETLQELRKLPHGSKLPAIAMTSYAMAGDREKLLNSGFDGYIEKPIDPDRVIHQIQQILKAWHEDSHR